MLLRNLDMTSGVQGMLVNGSRGVVVGFKSREVGPQPFPSPTYRSKTKDPGVCTARRAPKHIHR